MTVRIPPEVKAWLAEIRSDAYQDGYRDGYARAASLSAARRAEIARAAAAKRWAR